MLSGVYVITNTANGNQYIGSAVNVQKRWNEHRRTLNRNDHHNLYLQRAWNKYGSSAFEFKVIEECNIIMLLFREQHYIDSLIPAYNISPIAGSRLGSKHTPESIIRMSVAQKAIVTPERRAILSDATKKVMTPERRAMLSETTKKE